MSGLTPRQQKDTEDEAKKLKLKFSDEMGSVIPAGQINGTSLMNLKDNLTSKDFVEKAMTASYHNMSQKLFPSESASEMDHGHAG